MITRERDRELMALAVELSKSSQAEADGRIAVFQFKNGAGDVRELGRRLDPLRIRQGPRSRRPGPWLHTSVFVFAEWNATITASGSLRRARHHRGWCWRSR